MLAGNWKILHTCLAIAYDDNSQQENLTKRGFGVVPSLTILPVTRQEVTIDKHNHSMDGLKRCIEYNYIKYFHIRSCEEHQYKKTYSYNSSKY